MRIRDLRLGGNFHLRPGTRPHNASLLDHNRGIRNRRTAGPINHDSSNQSEWISTAAGNPLRNLRERCHAVGAGTPNKRSQRGLIPISDRLEVVELRIKGDRRD